VDGTAVVRTLQKEERVMKATCLFLFSCVFHPVVLREQKEGRKTHTKTKKFTIYACNFKI
jgi:hypothetical protein